MLHKKLPASERHAPWSWSYANAAARTGATGFTADDVGKVAWQDSDGTAWVLTATTPTWIALGGSGGGGGKILQVLSVTKRDTFSLASSTFTDVTGLSVAITPAFTGSKVLAIANVVYCNTGTTGLSFVRLERTGDTYIGAGDAAGSRVRASVSGRSVSDANSVCNAAMSVLDSPNTTSSVTYKITCAAESGTVRINTTGNDLDHAAAGLRAISTLTLMEIAP